jgi:predicted nucleic acid-binding protein
VRVLLDTNILLRLVDPASTQHTSAVEAIDALKSESSLLCLVPQVIYEFWTVATRPVTANGMGMTAKVADRQVATLLRLFTMLRDERAIFEHWHTLVTKHNVRGVKAHDVRLAAAMLKHDLSHVLTFDPTVFRRFEQITVLNPKQVAGP